MADRLLVKALRSHVGDRVDEFYRSHSAGTGTWHVGEAMNPPAATEVRRRGGDPGRFAARHLVTDLIDESDLILCATAEQVDRVLRLRPQARARTFVLGEFGRLLRESAASPRAPAAPDATDSVVTTDAAPGGVRLDPATCHARGVGLVAAVDAQRAGAAKPPPWLVDRT
jgi:protein-tyrosine phosphatase